MKPDRKNYIKATVLNAATVIEIENILDFCRFIEQHNIKDVFVINNDLKFAVLAQNAVLQTDTNAFLNAEDAKNASLNHFPTAQDFYDAAQLDLYNYEDFQLVRICGIKDKALFNQIQEEGFVAGFEQYKSYIRSEDPDKELPFSDILALFNHSVSHNFINFESFFDALKLGFEHAETFQAALDKGFENAKE